MKDYLIVGAGLAGIAFAETAFRNGRSVVVFDDDSQHSSSVAAGVYNPVILKRYSKLADAQLQLDTMQRFYQEVSRRLKIDVNFAMPVLRRFASVEEQNDWFVAADKPGLSPFMSTELVHDEIAGIDAPFGFGLVMQTGYVDTSNFLDRYRAFLGSLGAYRNERFDVTGLSLEPRGVSYRGIQARHVVFAQGFGIKDNLYFNHLPLEGTKGETLTIRAQMGLNAIVKAGVFVLPIAASGLYRVGATYEWTDKTETTTAAAREELLGKLAEVVKVPFEVVDQQAGIRPTVKDRKPLVGTHPFYPQLHLLNGLGTRGVMLSPLMAEYLFERIEFGKPLPKEVDLNRFPYDAGPRPDRS